jgi:2,5-diketo-D-gluconate reductase A
MWLFLTLPLAACLSASGTGAPTQTIVLRTQVSGRAPVVLPTVSLGTGGYDNDTAAAAVGAAYAAGFRGFHTAFDYYNLPGVGRGLAALPRDDVFVTAMTSPCIHTASPPVRVVKDAAACTALTASEINQTLALLGLDSVDLLLLHGPSEPFGYQGACDANISAINSAQWAAYTEALLDGRARSIGVSNYCQSCLHGLGFLSPSGSRRSGDGDVVAPSVNQLQLHVGTGADPGGLMSFCADAGIVVQAYSPLADGGVVSDALCASVGKKYNRSAADVGLRWVVEKNLTALVVKANDPGCVLACCHILVCWSCLWFAFYGACVRASVRASDRASERACVRACMRALLPCLCDLCAVRRTFSAFCGFLPRASPWCGRQVPGRRYRRVRVGPRPVRGRHGAAGPGHGTQRAAGRPSLVGLRSLKKKKRKEE